MVFVCKILVISDVFFLLFGTEDVLFSIPEGKKC